MNKPVPLIILDSPQISLFNFIKKTMEPILLILFSIISKGEFLSVTGNFRVKFKSFINGSMDGKFKILMSNVEFKMNSKSNFKP